MHSTSVLYRPSTFVGGAPISVVRGVARGRRSLLEALLLVALAAGSPPAVSAVLLLAAAPTILRRGTATARRLWVSWTRPAQAQLSLFAVDGDVGRGDRVARGPAPVGD